MLNIPGKESLLPLTSEKVRENQVYLEKVPLVKAATHIFTEEVDKLLKVCVRNRERSCIERVEHSERVNP